MNRLLLIDDEESNVRVLSMSLRADGYEVLTAYSGEEGLRVFEQQSPNIVLTDIKMPGMDGIEVLKQIKALKPDTEVIIITGHGDIDNAIDALQHGASDFINKPVRDEALAVALMRAREKIDIRRQLKAHTDNLEIEVARATRELHRQSNFLAKLIRSSNDGIIATDRQLTIVVFNPGAERIFGHRGEDVIDRRCASDLLPPEVTAFFDNPRPNSDIQWQETRIQAQDDALIPVRFTAMPLFENGQMMGTVSFFQDLREIKRLEAELVHNERLAAIGQTVAGVAHGVKNILHGFKGGSYLVELGMAKQDSDKLEKGWDMIRRNISRTSDLVLDLLAYAKDRQPEPQRCSPNDIVRDVCDLMQDVATAERVVLKTDLDPAIDTICLDPRSVHSCLTNLVANAIDACLFDTDTAKDWRVTIKTRIEGGQVIFTVTDNGMGMSREVQDKLFSSFFSTKGHRGTGLGMLVTQKLVEEHGGRIDVTSQPGKGTRVTIQLPYRPARECDNGGPVD